MKRLFLVPFALLLTIKGLGPAKVSAENGTSPQSLEAKSGLVISFATPEELRKVKTHNARVALIQDASTSHRQALKIEFEKGERPGAPDRHQS